MSNLFEEGNGHVHFEIPKKSSRRARGDHYNILFAGLCRSRQLPKRSKSNHASALIGKSFSHIPRYHLTAVFTLDVVSHSST